MYFFQYFYFLCRFLIRLLFRLPKVKRDAIQYLRSAEKKQGGQMHPPSFRDIIRFHSFGQLFVTDSFLQCHNRFSNAQETEQHLLYYTMMHLDDHLIDDRVIDFAHLDQMFYHPDLSLGKTVDELVLIDAHRLLLGKVHHREAYFRDLEKIHIAQKKSQSQINDSLSFEELVRMDQEKGGFTFLMLHHFMDVQESQKIGHCLYQLGAVIQMMNDLMDIHKDLKNGVATFANTANHFQQLEAVYLQQIDAMRRSIKALPYSKQHQQRLSILFSLISGMGCTAIDNLKKIQGTADSLTDLHQVPRKSLIVDMERWMHVFRLARHSYRLGKL